MSGWNQLFYQMTETLKVEKTVSILMQQRQWSAFIKNTRKHFDARDFEECMTPIMVDSPGTEPSIDPFEMQMTIENRREKKYLRTSPEIAIKKLICVGMGNCFEIAQVFRDKEWTNQHRPEFTMLEWYRINGNLSQIEEDVKSLIGSLAKNKQIKFASFSIAELFSNRLGLEILPTTTLEEYRKFCELLKLDHQSMTTIDDYFFLIWTSLIEPTFHPDEVTFVKDYPPFQKAYSQIHLSTGWAQRMEFYWKGFELGNAFQEETDQVRQKMQFDLDNQKKIASGKNEVQLDQEFLKLMPQMPECAGIAVGLDRLFLCIQ